MIFVPKDSENPLQQRKSTTQRFKLSLCMASTRHICFFQLDTFSTTTRLIKEATAKAPNLKPNTWDEENSLIRSITEFSSGLQYLQSCHGYQQNTHHTIIIFCIKEASSARKIINTFARTSIYMGHITSWLVLEIRTLLASSMEVWWDWPQNIHHSWASSPSYLFMGAKHSWEHLFFNCVHTFFTYPVKLCSFLGNDYIWTLLRYNTMHQTLMHWPHWKILTVLATWNGFGFLYYYIL